MSTYHVTVSSPTTSTYRISVSAAGSVYAVSVSPVVKEVTVTGPVNLYGEGAGNGTDVNAIHKNVSSEISTLSIKASPVLTDTLMIEDSEASNSKKRITIGGIPAPIHTHVVSDITDFHTRTVLTAIMNLDSYISAGRYRWSSSSVPINSPLTTHGTMDVDNDGGQPLQKVWGGVGEGTATIYIRRFNNGTTWTAWSELSVAGHEHVAADVTDFDTEVSNNATVADNTAHGALVNEHIDWTNATVQLTTAHNIRSLGGNIETPAGNMNCVTLGTGTVNTATVNSTTINNGGTLASGPATITGDGEVTGTLVVGEQIECDMLVVETAAAFHGSVSFWAPVDISIVRHVLDSSNSLDDLGLIGNGNEVNFCWYDSIPAGSPLNLPDMYMDKRGPTMVAWSSSGAPRVFHRVLDTTWGEWVEISLDGHNHDHDLLEGYVANEHIDWTNTASNLNTTGGIICSTLGAATIDSFTINNGGTLASGPTTITGDGEVTGTLVVGEQIECDMLVCDSNATFNGDVSFLAPIDVSVQRHVLDSSNSLDDLGMFGNGNEVNFCWYGSVPTGSPLNLPNMYMEKRGPTMIAWSSSGAPRIFHRVLDTTWGEWVEASLDGHNHDHDLLEGYVENEHINWTSASTWTNFYTHGNIVSGSGGITAASTIEAPAINATIALSAPTLAITTIVEKVPDTGVTIDGIHILDGKIPGETIDITSATLESFPDITDHILISRDLGGGSFVTRKAKVEDLPGLSDTFGGITVTGATGDEVVFSDLNGGIGYDAGVASGFGPYHLVLKNEGGYLAIPEANGTIAGNKLIRGELGGLATDGDFQVQDGDLTLGTSSDPASTIQRITFCAATGGDGELDYVNNAWSFSPGLAQSVTLPAQGGATSGDVLTTNGTTASWATSPAGVTDHDLLTNNGGAGSHAAIDLHLADTDAHIDWTNATVQLTTGHNIRSLGGNIEAPAGNMTCATMGAATGNIVTINTGTINERVGSAGVTIDSMLIKDGQISGGAVNISQATEELSPVGTDQVLISRDVGGGAYVSRKAAISDIPVASSIITQDEGTLVDAAATTLNFVGLNVSVSNAGGHVTEVDISGGEINSGANVGIVGEGPYAGKSGVTLNFKKFVSNSTALEITSAANNIYLDIVPGDEAIEVGFDGGGSALVVGSKIDVVAKCDMTITGWTMLADVTGSLSIGVWKDTYANYPPTVDDVILYPTISSSNKAQATGYNLSVSKGDVLRFNIESVTTIGRATMALTGPRLV